MLLNLTLLTVAAVVLALAGYLIAVTFILVRASRTVAGIADGLEAVRDNTRPLPEKLTTINSALNTLLSSLGAADRQLVRAASVFRLH